MRRSSTSYMVLMQQATTLTALLSGRPEGAKRNSPASQEVLNVGVCPSPVYHPSDMHMLDCGESLMLNPQEFRAHSVARNSYFARRVVDEALLLIFSLYEIPTGTPIRRVTKLEAPTLETPLTVELAWTEPRRHLGRPLQVACIFVNESGAVVSTGKFIVDHSDIFPEDCASNQAPATRLAFA